MESKEGLEANISATGESEPNFQLNEIVLWRKFSSR